MCRLPWKRRPWCFSRLPDHLAPGSDSSQGDAGLGQGGDRAGLSPAALGTRHVTEPPAPDVPSSTDTPGDALGKVSRAPVVYLGVGKECIKASLISPQLSLLLSGCVSWPG